MNYNQDDWARLLAVVQFRLNSSINKITKKAPFDIIYRYKSEIRMNIASIMKGSFFIREAPAARQEIKLRKRDEKIFKEL